MPPQPKIVVVEDNHDLRFLYTFKLENEGFQVRAAGDGEKGLTLIQEFRPDIILLDLLLPGISGPELLARLREQEWASDIRVIVLTNVTKNEAPQTLRFLVVDRYIVKAHYTPAQVVNVVREVLSEKPT
ncbi:MAG TPA: response regulator [Candidatus Saccharimonadales bacterium]|nr:response regulator [Candidatus Saccharimonadales bacterium]